MISAMSSILLIEFSFFLLHLRFDGGEDICFVSEDIWLNGRWCIIGFIIIVVGDYKGDYMDTNLLFGHLERLFIQVSLNRVHLIVSFLDLYMNIEWMEETSSSRFWISFLYSGWFGIITILVIRITNKINCNEKIKN